MSSTPTSHFHTLRSKIREWKAGDLFQPGEQSLRQFRKLAPVHLLPIMTELQQALEAEGVRATVREMSEEMGFLSLTIDDFDIELSFGPSEYRQSFRMFTCQTAGREPVVTRLLAYRDLELGAPSVLGAIEEAVLCASIPFKGERPGSYPLGTTIEFL